jgi:hypothetical protein
MVSSPSSPSSASSHLSRTRRLDCASARWYVSVLWPRRCTLTSVPSLVPLYVPSCQRVLRLMRCLVPFRSILRTFAITLKTCFPVLGILLCLLYFFAVLGMSFFAGRLTHHSLPPDCAYAVANYWPINWDHFPNALLTQFHLLVVNNWMVTMDAGVLATGTSWTYLYFIGFYLFGTIVMVNVIVAFTLDTFMMYSDDGSGDDDKPGSGGDAGVDPKPFRVTCPSCHTLFDHTPASAVVQSLLDAILAHAAKFGIRQRLAMIKAKYGGLERVDPEAVVTSKKYQSKLIKLLSDQPELHAQIQLYEGISFCKDDDGGTPLAGLCLC